MSAALVIIPTLDEKENIEEIVRATMARDSKFDLLVVDDESKDGTASIVQELQKEFSDRLFLMNRKGPKGLGLAYISGFQWALERDYDYILEMDADFSHDPLDLDKLLSACANDGADMAIGSRYVKGVNVVNWPMKRVLLSYLASKYVKFITGIPINDTTAGFVCYSRKLLESIDLNGILFVGYAFQIEMKFKAWKKGFSFKEVSVIFTDRSKGESKMNGSIINEAAFGVIKLALSGKKIKSQNGK